MAVAVLFTTSCAKEFNETSIAGGEVSVSFTANLADLGTRAYGEAGEITYLKYFVYDDKMNLLSELSGTKGIVANQTATVNLVLIKGMKYNILFWAESEEATTNQYYSVADGVVTVNYDGALANDESRDAFFGVLPNFDPKDAGASVDVTLRRPFAQLNAKVTNYAEIQKSGVEVEKSKISTKVYNTLNPFTGEVSGLVEGEFALNAMQADAEEGHLSMNYLLVPATRCLADVTMTFVAKKNGANGAEITLPSVSFSHIPLQRNYKTNIFGQFLTKATDFDVTIDANWVDTEVVNIWDGKSVTAPALENDIYTIAEPSELAWLAAAVNGTLETRAAADPQDFAGKTFRLTKDIDLGGKEWTPIGNASHIFKGTFDGDNHIIRNLVITGNNSNVGLFGVTHDGEVKNFTVVDAKVSGRLNVGVVAGQPYTSKYTNITVQGLIQVNGMAYVGGVGGKNAYADWTNIKVEAAEGSYVKANSVENGTAYRTYVGGVVGFNGEGSHKFSNITSNINVEGTTCDVGGLFGIAHYGNQFESCSCTGNVTITTDEVENALEMGGIAGVWHNETGYTVTLTNCSFDGELSTPNIAEDVDFYYGGLVGAPYSATGTGKLIIGGKHYVANAAQLQAALDAATGESTIYFGADIVGDVTAVQKQGVKVTIDGEGKKFNGSIKVHSNSNYYADAALTVKNVDFEVSAASVNVIEALENGSERYSSNITVEDCTFTATGEAVKTSVAVQVKATRNVTVKNCTATNMHSLIQAQSCDTGDVKVIDCKVNGKNGVAFKQVKSATVEGTTITALEYGIRFDGNIDNYGIVVKNNNVTAVQPLIVRKMTGKNNTIALEGTNTLTTEAEYQVVVTNGSDDEAYVKPTGTYTLTGADDYTMFPAPFPVASWDEFTAALAAGEDNIKLTADITVDANYQLQKAVTLNLGGYSMTLPMINIHTKTTVKNGTINGKVYARKNAEIVFNKVTFSGAVADNLSTEGHLAIQGGCKSLYAKDCLFSPTSVSGSQTKPLSFEGGSTIMKFENCEFKSSPYKKQVYLNSLSATGSLEFINCNFNNKTPNIMFAAACPLTNVTMSDTTKLSSVTFEINRAKEAVTAEDLAYLRTLIANNSFSSVRLFYAGGSSEYIR